MAFSVLRACAKSCKEGDKSYAVELNSTSIGQVIEYSLRCCDTDLCNHSL